MSFEWEDFSPKENASYGQERAKSTAHLAVRELFYRRIKEGLTQEHIAKEIGKDPAWVSRVIKGPGNWTLKTLGALVVALDGILTIRVTAREDDKTCQHSNADAYFIADTELHPIAPAEQLQQAPTGDLMPSSLMDLTVNSYGNNYSPLPASSMHDD